MIRSFRDRDTEQLFRKRTSIRFQSIARTALRKLDTLNVAVDLWRDLGLPGNRLEALKGNREGEHSIRVNDRWRICFRWERGESYDVEIADYHSGRKRS